MCREPTTEELDDALKSLDVTADPIALHVADLFRVQRRDWGENDFPPPEIHECGCMTVGDECHDMLHHLVGDACLLHNPLFKLPFALEISMN